jgi:hypothetical protein
MSSLVLVEVADEANKPVLPLLDVLYSIAVYSRQLEGLAEIGLVLLGLVLGEPFGQIEIFKLHSMIAAYLVLNGFGLIHELIQGVIVILNHIFLTSLLLRQLALQLNFLKVVDLFFKEIVDQELDQGRDMS